MQDLYGPTHFIGKCLRSAEFYAVGIVWEKFGNFYRKLVLLLLYVHE